jgi:glutamate decarboxylase
VERKKFPTGFDHSLWLFFKASFGGGLLLSQKHRHPRLCGIQKADSVTWNTHELMGTTLHCSTFHTKHEGLLSECDELPAGSLLKEENFYVTSQKSIHCGNHNNAFKLWLQWRSRGDLGFENRVDRLMELTAYHVKRLKERNDRFHLLTEPELVNVCFWYVPKRLRDAPHDDDKAKQLSELCPCIKALMMKAGSVMVNVVNDDDKSMNFFRSIISNEGTTEHDIDFLLDEIDRLGEDL